MIRITRVSPVDAGAAVSALMPLYHRPPAEVGRMTQMLDDPDFLLLLAELDDGYAGYLYGQMIDRLDGTRLLLIYDVAVAAEHQHKGVGTELMRSVFAHARDSGASGCWLVSDDDNAIARAFYEHLDGEEWPAVGFRWQTA